MPKKNVTEEDVTQAGLDITDLETEEKEEAPLKTKGSEELTDEVVAMSDDVPVKLVAVLGRKNMVLKDLLKLKVGQAINLERAPNEFVDLVANGKLIARGELVEIDGKLGVRVIKMIK